MRISSVTQLAEPFQNPTHKIIRLLLAKIF
jgi:hypothetical protein